MKYSFPSVLLSGSELLSPPDYVRSSPYQYLDIIFVDDLVDENFDLLPI